MFAGLELQVLAGVYNVAHVQAASTCVAFVGQRIPLEEVYRLQGPVEDSDTLRGMWTRQTDPRLGETSSSTPWTAGLFLEGIAHARGFRTAKAARLDTNRAANWVLRALAEGQIHWAFRPPQADGQTRSATRDGIWLRELDARAGMDFAVSGDEEEEPITEDHGRGSDVDQGRESSAEQEHQPPAPPTHFQSQDDGLTDESSESYDGQGQTAFMSTTTRSRFAALQLDEDE